MKPRLVAVAHGTRDAEGPPVIEFLMKQVGRRLPDVEVVTSYVELVDPTLADVMLESQSASVVVPLLLSTGYHVTHDVPLSARLSRPSVRVARPLGPHPLLAAALAMRLAAAGARRGDAVMMVATGSKDPDALMDTLAAGRMLQARWGAPVKVAHLTGSAPPVAEVVHELRRDGHKRVVAAPYLLAPGHFARIAHAQAVVARVSAVADVIGYHPLLVELVARRYLAAIRPGRMGSTGPGPVEPAALSAE